MNQQENHSQGPRDHERVTTPSTQARLAWYAGLGAMAAIGLIEWPVALVVGATHFVQNHSNDELADQLAEGVGSGA
jgi:hypothetical protein